MELGTKSQRGGEERREWNGGGALRPVARKGGLYLDVCAGAPEFLVTPLLMGLVCQLNQSRISCAVTLSFRTL